MGVFSPKLPPGFRFHPTDQELIASYLKNKISCPSHPLVSIIADIDLYKFNPWELPGMEFLFVFLTGKMFSYYVIGSLQFRCVYLCFSSAYFLFSGMALFGEHEWFFFSPRDRKYPNGSRPNRAAGSGYWKATGTDKPILTSSGSQCLGVKKALVFYKGRPPKGIKTNWMMLEYRLLDDTHQLHRLRGSMRLDDWVLCRVRQKSSSPQQKEDNYDSSSGSSSPFAIGCLQNQQDAMVKEISNPLKDYDYDIQASLMANLGSEEADEQGQADFQEDSPGYSVTSLDSNSHRPTVSFKEALESLSKVISTGTFEELVPPPKKSPYTHISTSSNAENATSIFQLSSSAMPGSFPRSFSEFMM
ncbi:hypothetical protein K2173_001662 [Erythroxylum novogranatense]|uniref:NAC domain-containing protein n=1 Tax=Erythroxylum novogranatense TaxID=1862640 RepID=A0AAV8T456_9ROSI|nr:hypothetical protein K2173_001662 [Erythroxylum novogranatense]